MGQNLRMVGFDADDTLWQNERFFKLTQDHFADLLKDYAEPGHLADRLLEAEHRNIGRYGFGIKGFVLSMIETALEVTENRVSGEVIGELIAAGQEMLAHSIELLPHVQSVVEQVADQYHVVMITKGDLLDQERKLAQSGLGELFDGVEIVSHKTTKAYQDIFDRHGYAAKHGLMVGNSMKSDVIPMIDAGGWGVYVPGQITWALEHAEAPEDHPRFNQIKDLSGLPEILLQIG